MLRVLVAMLGVMAGRVVPDEALVDGLWGEDWSRERERNLHTHVSALRRRLAVAEPGRGGSRVVRSGGGYRLVLAETEVDAGWFQSLAGQGRQAARAGEVAAAAGLFAQALGLWRGAALADVVGLCPRLAGDAATLEELRAGVVEERVACDLALGRHGEVAGEGTGLVAEFSLRERLAGQVMVALYRCGRRGEALALFDSTRRVLGGELGLDPGPELAQIQAKVLADDPSLAAPPAVAAATVSGGPQANVLTPGLVPRQLPIGTGFFAGREAELKALDGLPNQSGDLSGPGALVVAGMAGVGKTALAVHWARKIAGRFPDGQLYVNLRGYDGEGAPVTAEEVAGWFLVALGVPAAQVPAGAQERVGLYRSVLADRRVLIVLDNARDAAQVRPLLPGSPGCLVIVTSRSVLAGLVAEGARPLRLNPLAAEASVRLLVSRLGAERVAAEPEAAASLAGWCGGLPLALAVTAGRAAADPALLLAVLAGQLARAEDAGFAGHAAGGASAADGPDRLDELETGDPATSLRELFSWSLHQLSEPAAEMFALLGVHCGPDITVAAAASLAGILPAQARQTLAELAGASLVAEHRPGRYVMHDLLRGYAAEQARQALDDTGVRDAVERSLDHYVHTMAITHPLWPFTPAPAVPGVSPEPMADEAQLVAWVQAEQQVVLQAIAQAAVAGFVTEAWQMLGFYLEGLIDRGVWADSQAAARAVLAAAQSAGDHTSLGWTHWSLGTYCNVAGAYDDARAHLFQALDDFEQAGDLKGQAHAHLMIDYSQLWMGDKPAHDQGHAEQALRLSREIGDMGAAANALTSLAESHADLGNWELARSYAQQALGVFSELGHPDGQGYALYCLGRVHHQLGEYGQAIDCYQQAIALPGSQLPGFRKDYAGYLAHLGDAHQAAGDLPSARRAWQQALEIFDDLHLPDDLGIRAKIEQAGAPS